MSAATSTFSTPPIVWDQNTILEKGLDFVKLKKREFDHLQCMWKGRSVSSVSNILVSDDEGEEKIKNTANILRTEIRELSKACIAFSRNNNLPKETTEKIEKVADAALAGLGYFDTVIEKTYTPAHLVLDKLMQKVCVLSNKGMSAMSTACGWVILIGFAVDLGKTTDYTHKILETVVQLWLVSTALQHIYLNERLRQRTQDQLLIELRSYNFEVLLKR